MRMYLGVQVVLAVEMEECAQARRLNALRRPRRANCRRRVVMAAASDELAISPAIPRDGSTAAPKLRADGPSTKLNPCKRAGLGKAVHSDAAVAPRPPRHRRRTAAECRAAMLHGCARRGLGTRLPLRPRSVLMVIGPNSTPASAQVTDKPASSCAIVASEALTTRRPTPTVKVEVCMRTLRGALGGLSGWSHVQYRRIWY